MTSNTRPSLRTFSAFASAVLVLPPAIPQQKSIVEVLLPQTARLDETFVGTVVANGRPCANCDVEHEGTVVKADDEGRIPVKAGGNRPGRRLLSFKVLGTSAAPLAGAVALESLVLAPGRGGASQVRVDHIPEDLVPGGRLRVHGDGLQTAGKIELAAADGSTIAVPVVARSSVEAVGIVPEDIPRASSFELRIDGAVPTGERPILHSYRTRIAGDPVRKVGQEVKLRLLVESGGVKGKTLTAEIAGGEPQIEIAERAHQLTVGKEKVIRAVARHVGDYKVSLRLVGEKTPLAGRMIADQQPPSLSTRSAGGQTEVTASGQLVDSSGRPAPETPVSSMVGYGDEIKHVHGKTDNQGRYKLAARLPGLIGSAAAFGYLYGMPGGGGDDSRDIGDCSCTCSTSIKGPARVLVDWRDPTPAFPTRRVADENGGSVIYKADVTHLCTGESSLGKPGCEWEAEGWEWERWAGTCTIRLTQPKAPVVAELKEKARRPFSVSLKVTQPYECMAVTPPARIPLPVASKECQCSDTKQVTAATCPDDRAEADSRRECNDIRESLSRLTESARAAAAKARIDKVQIEAGLRGFGDLVHSACTGAQEVAAHCDRAHFLNWIHKIGNAAVGVISTAVVPPDATLAREATEFIIGLLWENVLRTGVEENLESCDRIKKAHLHRTVEFRIRACEFAKRIDPATDALEDLSKQLDRAIHRARNYAGCVYCDLPMAEARDALSALNAELAAFQELQSKYRRWRVYCRSDWSLSNPSDSDPYEFCRSAPPLP